MNGAASPRPLDGLRVVELGSMAPAPFCSMILADFGADVALVERPGGVRGGINPGWPALFARGKRAVVADLQTGEGRALVRRLAARADVFVEGFRPGVAERLGLGPEVLMGENDRLVYARVTGWGQTGPYAAEPGHDINYIALGGALTHIGIEAPLPPNAFLGDFSAGSLMAVIGILMALQARQRTGHGQVVDAAIVDGASYLTEIVLEMHRHGHGESRADNIVCGRAPFYRAYRCADDRWFSIGAIEPKFYGNLLAVLGIEDEPLDRQLDRNHWDALAERIAAIFRTRSRDEWERAFQGREACAAPVLDPDDLMRHPHLISRGRFASTPFAEVAAAPAPLLSRTPGAIGDIDAQPSTDFEAFERLLDWDRDPAHKAQEPS